MSTSTPPAWHWLHECAVPVAVMDPAVVNKSLTTDPCPDCGWRHKQWVLCHEHAQAREALSADSCNLSDSDDSRVQNDSPDPTYQGCRPSERYPSDGPDDSTPESAWAYMASRVGVADQCANGERNLPPALIPSDQCPECRSAPGQSHATGCDVSRGPDISCDRKDVRLSSMHADNPNGTSAVRDDNPSGWSREHRIGTRYLDPDTGETVMPGDFFGEKELRWMPDKDGNRHDVDPLVTVVESCPECGAVTDIEYEDAGPADTFAVPFKVQAFIFEELAEVQAEYLHDILKDHAPLIVEMARDRFRKGYAKYGSAAYQWDAETRLTNVLEELADSVVYLTTGAVE